MSDVTSKVPVVEVRELDTIMTVKDGSVIVIGGLMEERTGNTSNSVPILGDIPILGKCFQKP